MANYPTGDETKESSISDTLSGFIDDSELEEILAIESGTTEPDWE
jgi:hypothetical protein